MQKITTTLKKTDLITANKRFEPKFQLQPTNDTLHKILQFASCYRATKMSENQYIELYLN
jgi:hypothetical protein